MKQILLVLSILSFPLILTGTQPQNLVKAYDFNTETTMLVDTIPTNENINETTSTNVGNQENIIWGKIAKSSAIISLLSLGISVIAGLALNVPFLFYGAIAVFLFQFISLVSLIVDTIVNKDKTRNEKNRKRIKHTAMVNLLIIACTLVFSILQI